MTTHADVPLVTDLDDTLIRSDLLLECILKGFDTAPLTTLRLILRHARAPQVLKAHLADRFPPDLETLPRDREVEALLDGARAAGRETVLASGSTTPLVTAFADRFGPFDRVHASDLGTNLTSASKARLLVESFGQAGFDYIGDSAKDIPVWQDARKAIIARREARFHDRLRASGLDPIPVGAPDGPGPLLSLLSPIGPFLAAAMFATGTYLQGAFSPWLLGIALGIAALFLAFELFLELRGIDRSRRKGRDTALTRGEVKLERAIKLCAGLAVLGYGLLAVTSSGPFLIFLAVGAGHFLSPLVLRR